MPDRDASEGFHGAAKIWEDFASGYPEISSELDGLNEVGPEEFKDGYVHLPYDESPVIQECRW